MGPADTRKVEGGTRMADENIAEAASDLAGQGEAKRERSKIAFPYNDLKDAISVAQAIWDNVGGNTCDKPCGTSVVRVVHTCGTCQGI